MATHPTWQWSSGNPQASNDSAPPKLAAQAFSEQRPPIFASASDRAALP